MKESRLHCMRLRSRLLAICLLGVMSVCAGTALAQVDIVFILDVTESTGMLLPNWQSQMPNVVAMFQAAIPGAVRFGLASHLDYPFGDYGDVGEWAYRLESPLNANPQPLYTALGNLTIGSGLDDPESQYEAIYQAIMGTGRDLTGDGDFIDVGEIVPSPVGWGANNVKIIILFTSPVLFHDRDTEPNYPYVGSQPVAGRTATLAALAANPPIIFGLVTGTIKDGGVGPQTGEPYDEILTTRGRNQLQELCDETGGGIYDVGEDLSGLEEAIDSVILTIPSVPSVTEWGLVVLVVMLLLSALWVYRTKRKARVVAR